MMELSTALSAKFEKLQTSYPVKRSALIPMLMYAQDEFGCVSDEMIAEIGRRLDLNNVQVEETLAYYSMLHRKPWGKHHVQICTNVACMLKGGNELLERAKKRLEIGQKEVTADGVFSLEEVECIGACTGAPAMQVNYDFYENLTPLKFDRILMQGGYKALEKALKEMTPESIIEEVKKSNLRGRGGAGFPTGMKWSFVPKDTPKPKYVICNADESEPGTCKDRPLMEMDPHQLIEGMVIAGRAISSHQGFIYIRGEYRYVLDIVDGALGEAYARGYLGKNILGTGFDFDLLAHTGAGAYECGEESALMESLEGKRGYPRIKPPFPAVVGLYGCPTIINNVETLSAVPSIIREGGDAYASRGTPKNGGTRMLCIAGHVNKPGIYEVRLGMNMKKFIYDVAGGIPDGKKLKAVIPGGSSCPLLAADEIDIPMDYDSVAKAGSMLGSGGMVIMDEDTCMVDMARRIMHFYAHESCGWCIPCREGTTWLRKTLERFHAGMGRVEDIDMIADLAKNMLGRTFCPLGDAAAMPTISIMKKWRNEFEDHLRGRCPYKSAGVLVGSR
ncbi:MAG: NADH oxidoreductase (quinone) subunit F [Acidobacteria bacterium 13_2_20CM_2_57_12]|nr:MAG: NADH oxidoreductase (quinone) subunit F [Acidobacteria bacterium 13_2_20CM_2_57_12]